MRNAIKDAGQTIRAFCSRRPRLTIGAGVVGTALAMAGNAAAAASSTTGIDYVSDLVTPIKSELTLAIVAGLGLLVVIMSVKAGVRLLRSFGR